MVPKRNSEIENELARQFRAGVETGSGLDAALDRLIEATGARAAGLWRLDEDLLKLLFHRSAADMPGEIHDAFATATREVSLKSTGLGIVQAALGQNPYPAWRHNPDGKLGGSATWLERFQAEQSLAVPVLASGRVLGVLAISAPCRFDENSFTWHLLVRLAEVLSQCWPW